MAKPRERASGAPVNADEDLRGIVRVGPAAVLPTLMVILALIAVMVFGITLLFRQ